MPKVSIITTTYNHKKFIAQTIESILAQSYTDRELLIGDDSPDSKAWDIIQSYVKKYPEKIKARHHKPNKGLVENMRFLCDQSDSSSMYFAFLEGDDLWIPSYLENKIAVFTQNPHVHLVYNNIDLIDENGKVFLKDLFTYKRYEFYKNCHGRTLHAPVFSYSSSMVTKWVYNKIGGIPNHNKTSLNSDNIFHYLIASKYDIYGLDESLTLYRRHSNNTSSNHIKLLLDASHDNDLLFSQDKDNQDIYYYRKINISLILAAHYSHTNKKKCKKELTYIYSVFAKLSFSQKLKYITVIILYIMPQGLSSFIVRGYNMLRTTKQEDLI